MQLGGPQKTVTGDQQGYVRGPSFKAVLVRADLPVLCEPGGGGLPDLGPLPGPRARSPPPDLPPPLPAHPCGLSDPPCPLLISMTNSSNPLPTPAPWLLHERSVCHTAAVQGCMYRRTGNLQAPHTIDALYGDMRSGSEGLCCWGSTAAGSALMCWRSMR